MNHFQDQSQLRPKLVAAIFTALALVLAACGGSATSTSSVEEQHEEAQHEEAQHEEAQHEEDFRFGEPADAADADRVIEIDANDDLTFDASEITVSAGETITFRITNTGNIPHDFTLGDQETQDEHEVEMAEMMAGGETMNHDDPNAVVLAAGETKELTWHFSEAGTVLIGCHQPGHYGAGMKGSVAVES